MQIPAAQNHGFNSEIIVYAMDPVSEAPAHWAASQLHNPNSLAKAFHVLMDSG